MTQLQQLGLHGVMQKFGVGISFVVLTAIIFLFSHIVWSRVKKHLLLLHSDHLHIKWIKPSLRAINLPIKFSMLFWSAALAFQFLPDFLKGSAEILVSVKSSVKIGLLASLGWGVYRLLGVLLRPATSPFKFTDTFHAILLILSRAVSISILFLWILDALGISITPLLASLGVGSVAVALALQETLSNFFSGLSILIDEPVRIGDFIELESGIQGHVTKIGWRSTFVRMLGNNVVVIPNSKLASQRITNYDILDKETAVLLDLGVSYDSDLEHVERVTCDVAKKILSSIEGGVSSFTPFIRFHTFNNSSIDFTVILRGKQVTDKFLLKHEFIKALHKRYEEEKITIPFPQRVVRMVSK